MEAKRRIARVVAVFGVALAAGHFVQNAAGSTADTANASPTGVTPLAAGPDAIGLEAPAPMLAGFTPANAPTSAQEQAVEPQAAASPDPLPQAEAEAPAETPVLAAPENMAQAEACPVALDLVAQEGAVVGVALTAPCHQNERIVLSHAGLAITAKTTDSGTLFTEIPALTKAFEITAILADATRVSATLDMPEAAAIRRFGIQWQGEDGFGIHALEGGATFGQDGDVSAVNPHTPRPGIPPRGGHLTLLGDSTVELPLLAEIYTWPTDPAIRVEVIAEAAVTTGTCGADLLGETVNSFGGETLVTDLTVAMPDCAGVGDYLMLKNLALEPKLAAAN